MMKAQQEKLSNIACVLTAESTKSFPEIIDFNGVLSYPTLSNGTVAGLALLVPMLVVFGEPILLPVNYCPTDIAALRKQSKTQVIKNDNTVKKQI